MSSTSPIPEKVENGKPMRPGEAPKRIMLATLGLLFGLAAIAAAIWREFGWGIGLGLGALLLLLVAVRAKKKVVDQFSAIIEETIPR